MLRRIIFAAAAVLALSVCLSVLTERSDYWSDVEYSTFTERHFGGENSWIVSVSPSGNYVLCGDLEREHEVWVVYDNSGSEPHKLGRVTPLDYNDTELADGYPFSWERDSQTVLLRCNGQVVYSANYSGYKPMPEYEVYLGGIPSRYTDYYSSVYIRKLEWSPDESKVLIAGSDIFVLDVKNLRLTPAQAD